MSARRFSRGMASTASSCQNPATQPSAGDVERFAGLRQWWNSRTRIPTAGCEALDYTVCEQIADAVIYARDEANSAWLHHARLRAYPGWGDVDVQHCDDVLAGAQSADIDIDAAMELTLEANTWWLAHPWRTESPLRAACMEDRPRAAWLNNARDDTHPEALTMWVWLAAALVDVSYQAVPCTWCASQVPRSGAMAWVAGRVVGHPVRRTFLNRLYGVGSVGSAAFGLQLLSTGWQCGLGSRDLCRGRGAPCPLIGRCAAYADDDFPFADAVVAVWS